MGGDVETVEPVYLKRGRRAMQGRDLLLSGSRGVNVRSWNGGNNSYRRMRGLDLRASTERVDTKGRKWRRGDDDDGGGEQVCLVVVFPA